MGKSIDEVLMQIYQESIVEYTKIYNSMVLWLKKQLSLTDLDQSRICEYSQMPGKNELIFPNCSL